MELSSRQAFVLVLVAGVVGTGLVVAGVAAAGYQTLASALWVLGYGAAVLVLWHGWIRPLEFGSAASDPDSE